jgi:plastocyanin
LITNARPAAPADRPALMLVTGLLTLVLAACSSGGSATPPPSGACVVADASNHVAISAKNVAFSAPCIEAAAGSPIVITFTNEEAVPHDIAVYTDATKQQELIRSDIITGPGATTTISVPAQQPGQLYFQCTIHTAMNGALVVKAVGGSGGGASGAPSGSGAPAPSGAPSPTGS